MRMFRILFTAITCMCVLTLGDTYANQTNDTCKAAIDAGQNCPAGCGGSLTSGSCIACGTNTFSKTTNSNCSPCPEGSTSTSGSTYCTCPEKTVSHGKYKPNNTTTTSATCEYTNINNLSCDNPTDYCGAGYHADRDTNSCQPNRTTCSDETNHIASGIKYHGNSTTCYATGCKSGYFLNNTANPGKCSSDTNLYTQCTDSIPCTQDLKNCKTSTDTDGISGSVTASGTSKNYSACECRNDKTVDISNGKGKLVCKYDKGTGSNTTWSNCTTDQVTQCNETFCEQNNSKICATVPAGYYSIGTEKVCHACDAGSTSDAGSTAKTQCYISNTTQFQDNFGNTQFTLPFPDNINYTN